MKNKVLIFFAIICITFGFTMTSVNAEEVTGENPSINEAVEEATMQIETIENIIVSIVVSFLGTGTVALIVKIALDQSIKIMTEKVRKAEEENKISKVQAEAVVATMTIFKDEFEKRIANLEGLFAEFITELRTTDKDINTLIEEYRTRDENIQAILESEFVKNE